MEAVALILSLVVFASAAFYAAHARRNANGIVRGMMAELVRAKEQKDIVIAETQGRIQKEIVERVEEINHTLRWLDEQVSVVLRQKKFAEEEISKGQKALAEGRELAIWANDEIRKAREQYNGLYKLNEDAHKAIRDNKKRLFEVQEGSLWLYDHYKKTVEFLSETLKENVDPNQILSVLHTATNNMHVVRQKFISEFGQSPEQYAQQKVSVKGKREDGGEEYIPTFSKN